MANETSSCVNRLLCQIVTLFQNMNAIFWAVNRQNEILKMWSNDIMSYWINFIQLFCALVSFQLINKYSLKINI